MDKKNPKENTKHTTTETQQTIKMTVVFLVVCSVMVGAAGIYEAARDWLLERYTSWEIMHLFVKPALTWLFYIVASIGIIFTIIAYNIWDLVVKVAVLSFVFSGVCIIMIKICF